MTAAGAPVPSSMKGTTLRLMVPAAVPSTAWSVSRPAPGKVSHALERRVRHLVHVDAVEVVDEVAGDDPQEDSLDRLERVGRPVEVPDRRRGAEAHGQVERKGDAGRAGDKGPRVRRVPDGPLPVGVQHVVPEHPGAHLRRHADQCHQTPDHVDVVVDKVVRRHVVCTHRGVVAGASPILRPPDLDLPALVLLDHREGGRDERLPRLKSVGARRAVVRMSQCGGRVGPTTRPSLASSTSGQQCLPASPWRSSS